MSDTAVVGTQLEFAARVLAARANPYDAGSRAQERADLAQHYSRVVMQIAVSAAVLATGIWLVLAGSDVKQREMGSGLIGLVAGYWLR